MHPVPHQIPDPTVRHPLPGHPRVVFLKAVVDQPNIVVGDYAYYDDPVEPERFVEKCVLHHYPFVGDRLVIGAYAAIATGVTFLMNGANHAMGGFSTFPFAIFGGAFAAASPPGALDGLSRGDTIVGPDVWIGHEAMILPGVTIGAGAVVAARAVVSRDVPPYAVVAGNPARVVRRRFSEETVERLLALAWWDWPAERVAEAIPAIVGADVGALERLKPEMPS